MGDKKRPSECFNSQNMFIFIEVNLFYINAGLFLVVYRNESAPKPKKFFKSRDTSQDSKTSSSYQSLNNYGSPSKKGRSSRDTSDKLVVFLLQILLQD